ncbi:MAG: hypothetical protein IPK94_12565 [Saprospiraceae bacterium]|nr:hypothetical protein [Saprospiraceae bacterium]
MSSRNGSGAWSFTNALAFFKPIGSGGDVPGPPAPPSNISKLEYYLDIDPGFGKATNIAITPGLDLKTSSYLLILLRSAKVFIAFM